MIRTILAKRFVPAIAAGLLAASAFAPSASAQSSDTAKKVRAVTRFLGFGSETHEEEAKRLKGLVDCPEVTLEDGVSTLRQPPNSEGDAVRYQISLGQMGRECVAQGARLSIRVGLEGQAILGPQGKPGNYGAGIRIAVVRTSDLAVLADKKYRVGATIPANAARADFDLLAEPMSVPNASPNPGKDYLIVVSFSQSGGEAPAAPKARRARRHQ